MENQQVILASTVNLLKFKLRDKTEIGQCKHAMSNLLII